MSYTLLEQAALDTGEKIIAMYRDLKTKGTSFTGRNTFVDMSDSIYFGLVEKARLDTIAGTADLGVLARVFRGS